VHHLLPPLQNCSNLRDHGHPYKLSDLWPPNSPDLNPIDYKIWVIILQRVQNTKVQDVKDLIQRLTDALGCSYNINVLYPRPITLAERYLRFNRCHGPFFTFFLKLVKFFLVFNKSNGLCCTCIYGDVKELAVTAKNEITWNVKIWLQIW